MPIDPTRLRARLDEGHAKRRERVVPPPVDLPAEAPTDEELLAAYSWIVDGEDLSDDDERTRDILAEMRAIVGAKSIQEAAEVIRWWGWPDEGEGDSPEAWVREYCVHLGAPLSDPVALAARVSRIAAELWEIADQLGATEVERQLFRNFFDGGWRQPHPRFAALAARLETRRLLALLTPEMRDTDNAQ
jgi:hypothetical protein